MIAIEEKTIYECMEWKDNNIEKPSVNCICLIRRTSKEDSEPEVHYCVMKYDAESGKWDSRFMYRQNDFKWIIIKKS